MQKKTRSINETYNLAATILDGLNGKNILALTGDLGSGKTTFVKGIAKNLDINQEITSPTFLLMKQYETNKNQLFHTLFHLDLYRIHSWKDIEALGLEEIWNDRKNLVLIEWADRIEKHVPNQTQWINFEHVDESTRAITVING